MRTSLVVAVLDEEKTIRELIKSIIYQTKKPDEVIIVDGESTDSTLSVISNFQFPISNKKLKIKTFTKKGNRSVGRNYGIKMSTGDIILSTDAGCILDKNWVKNITKPFEDPEVNVVAGYYKGKTRSVFEKCFVPYVLVMPDRVDPHSFLPASRSMALRKSIWEKAGGFEEEYSHNEDYVFANKLKAIKAKIKFQKDAVVSWIPRKNIKDAFIMFFRFALGDTQAGILRPKVLLVFARYILGLYLLLLSLIERSLIPSLGLMFGIFVYVLWSIRKNYKYVGDLRAYFFLPLFQFLSDFAILLGTTFGFFKKIN